MESRSRRHLRKRYSITCAATRIPGLCVSATPPPTTCNLTYSAKSSRRSTRCWCWRARYRRRRGTWSAPWPKWSSRNWRRRDRGVWEVRGEPQHFVYSKVLCWAALNKAAYIAAAVEQRRHYRRWTQAAFDIKTEALDRGWSESKRAFRQRYGSDALGRIQPGHPLLRLHRP